MEDSAPPPHLLIVDDDARLRGLLGKYLADQGFRVSTAGDAAEAERQIDAIAFDLLVLDVMMPGEDGIAFTRRLKADDMPPILLLTARGGPDDRIAGLEAGADDYLPKPFEPRELVLRIRTILRRQSAAPAQAAAENAVQLGAWRLDLNRGELRRGGEVVRLTSGELTLMRLLAERAGEPISREELAQATGQAQERTIDVQVTRLRRKIEDDPRAPHHLQTVRGKGYVLWLS
ncbi:response regulator [Zavarzinia compransoris]|uniref:response regulator n=1 Tax=Zavarzinia marina TaxID=2911065 RepID=UPI001F3207CA|nr:response regulator [Zavarzinia marina]MCF4164845.1 response regulator [Zavarzinia marina]